MANDRRTSQKRKFIESARQQGASEEPADFDRMLGGIAKAPPPETVQDRKASPKTKKPAK